MAKPTHGLRVSRKTDTMTVLFELVNKTTEQVEDTLQVEWADIHDGSRDDLALYGLSKFCMDRESATPMLEKLPAFSKLLDDTLYLGVWDRPRSSSGPTVRIEIEALAKLKGMTVKQAQLLLRKYEKDDQEAILTSEAVQAQLAKMKPAEVDEDAFDDLI